MNVEEIAKEDSRSAASDERKIHALGDRVLAAWEIASVTLSFLITAWIILPFAGNSKLIGAVPLGLAGILMFLSHRARRETARSIGWRTDNFFRAAKLLILPVSAAAVLIIIIGWFVNDNFRSGKAQMWQWVLWLPVWALVQQYALQGFINRRAQIIWGPGGRSILFVASAFALLHLPNPWLTLATFIGGLLWAAVYQRVPNLLALALSHALMSLLMVWALPASALKNFRVGFKYF